VFSRGSKIFQQARTAAQLLFGIGVMVQQYLCGCSKPKKECPVPKLLTLDSLYVQCTEISAWQSMLKVITLADPSPRLHLANYCHAQMVAGHRAQLGHLICIDFFSTPLPDLAGLEHFSFLSTSSSIVFVPHCISLRGHSYALKQSALKGSQE